MDDFLDRCRGPLQSFFRRRGFSFEDAEELVQDTLVRAHRGLAEIRRPEALRSWLFVIANNVYRNELRRRSAIRRSVQEVPLTGRADEQGVGGAPRRDVPGVPETQFDELAARRELELLRDLMRELPPRMRRIFVLRIGSELKYREIASLMEVSVDTVKSQIHQARARLRELFEERTAVPGRREHDGD